MSGSHSPGSDDAAQESSGGGEGTGETEIYSQAYSAPESEHFTIAPYVAPEPALYDYDSYEAKSDDSDVPPPRWPWVVGVVAIIAAISLVASVAILVTRNTSSENVAAPPTSSTTSAPPFQDEFTTTTTPPPPTTSEAPPPPPPPPPPPSTVTVTQPPPSEEPPPPAPSTPAAVAPPAPTSAPPTGPRYVTYRIWGTKAPLDRISVTYTDAAGRQRTQQNVYIPWMITLTPISMSDVGSVQASSLLRLSHLNCSIVTSDGQTLASQTNDDWQTSC
ncbi:hypothetical protein FZI85_24245 [Mycobacterium sp. CBMA293]|uniref:hypothetical protein n=1 Tax=unclassified Mycolicibacterium TaxID=2636767 RepID=UPI001324D0DB|nr:MULTISPECIES: hypothetical protein [unclassified Mycolicibacterium]MUL45517.1 hypothetical protein [Mycolicibacterium sp. CBMA 360]MUL96051.1 hypothetical protein [Mycolicibacterium sp. CBMA 230]MUM32564.1 hypothetical protein [Mycolicibacterium sp. CBMA 361]MUL60187.1 hypothetical protein [Mycolicibacterium sp. CBMA 335]MUL72974.1 hypothetical protein [Mycolicibacterium sp. CBMA 311]